MFYKIQSDCSTRVNEYNSIKKIVCVHKLVKNLSGILVPIRFVMFITFTAFSNKGKSKLVSVDKSHSKKRKV